MQYFVSILIILSVLIADNNFCFLQDELSGPNIIRSARDAYDIGEIISEEDQNFLHSVCHSDGSYNVDSMFSLSDYAGDIILISMNATW